MRNKQFDEKPRVVSDSQHPMAHAPLVVYKFGISVILVVVGLCVLSVAYYHHATAQDFLENFLTVFLIGMKAIGVLLALALAAFAFDWAHNRYHHGVLKHHERKTAKLKVTRMALQNESLMHQNAAIEYLPRIIKYAMEQGHNVTVNGKGELQVTNYLSNIHTLGGGNAGQLLLPQTSIDFIPEPYKMSDVLQGWQPSKSGILLAKGRELITVPSGESLCHTTFTGSTDAGKTNNERMLMIQLAFLNQCIYLCDRNYQPFREDKKLGGYYDYTPIEARLAHPPITETNEAVAMLRHLYGIVDDRRVERRKVQTANAIAPFKDIYLFFDELPAFAGEDREIMQLLGRLFREARQYGVFVIVALQDALNTTLNSDNGAVRENWLTNYYGGGDMTTARMVLNLAKNEQLDEDGLGVQGVTYLRAKGARIEHVKTRTPLCDDLATHMLLGEYAMPPFAHRTPTVVIDSQRPYVSQPLKEQVAFNYQPDQTVERSDDDDMRKVIAAWNGGHQTLDAIMGCTSFTQHKVRTLLAKAKAQGLVAPKGEPRILDDEDEIGKAFQDAFSSVGMRE